MEMDLSPVHKSSRDRGARSTAVSSCPLLGCICTQNHLVHQRSELVCGSQEGTVCAVLGQRCRGLPATTNGHLQGSDRHCEAGASRLQLHATCSELVFPPEYIKAVAWTGQLGASSLVCV